MALNAADYGYVLENGRIVMEDTCARLLREGRHQEFYLGLKEASVRGDAALEEEEDLALRPSRSLWTSPASSRRPRIVLEGDTTAADLPSRGAQSAADRVAMREKHLGIWRGSSWRQYGERARGSAWGLVALGLPRRATCVDPVRQPCRSGSTPTSAVLSVGGVTNGIYTTDSAAPGASTSSTTAGPASSSRRTRSSSTRSLEVRDRCPELVQDLRLRHGRPARLARPTR